MQKYLLIIIQKYFLITILGFFLSSCAIVHKMDIEQGNIITEDNLSHLHRGMTKAQVEEVMGTPTLINTFNSDRVTYVYTFKPGRGVMQEKQVTLLFSKGGFLNEIWNWNLN